MPDRLVGHRWPARLPLFALGLEGGIIARCGICGAMMMYYELGSALPAIVEPCRCNTRVRL